MTRGLVGPNHGTLVNGELKNSGPLDRNYLGSSSGLRMGGSICCGEFFVGDEYVLEVSTSPMSRFFRLQK